jgi:hypothetical protein
MFVFVAAEALLSSYVQVGDSGRSTKAHPAFLRNTFAGEYRAVQGVSGPPDRAYGEEMKGRKVAYAIMMGTCVTLIVLAWSVVRLYSTPAAVVMSLIAMVIPPLAAIVGNRDTDHSDNTDQHR